MKIFQNLNFVLVDTSHPGNIGACARAMNSMGILNLSLVNPKEFPSKESDARAKSGKKVLDKAKIHENLNEAINSSNLVIGTSARSRSMPWPMMEINDLGKVINESLAKDSLMTFPKSLISIIGHGMDLDRALVPITKLDEFIASFKFS